jgi:CheY-like chemotaxis protein
MDLLDFAMPGMSGLEVAVALRCMIPSVRLFLLTVHTSWEMELAARDAEVDAVFSKYENLNALFSKRGSVALLGRPTPMRSRQQQNA